jgi:hypothetical protein
LISILILSVAVASLAILAYPSVPIITAETATEITTTRSTYTTVRGSTYTGYTTNHVNFTYYVLHFASTYYSTTTWQEAVSTATSTSTSTSTNYHFIAISPYSSLGLNGTVFTVAVISVFLCLGAGFLLAASRMKPTSQDDDSWIWSCPKCGRELQPKVRFCDRCGSPQS